MDIHEGNLVLNGATSQLDRWSRALGEGFVQVDGRSFEELLTFAIDYARLINFYDLNNEIDGDWVEFFATDPTMVLAAIESTQPAEIESAFELAQRRTRRQRRFERKFQSLRATFEVILQMARDVDLWLRGLSRSTGEPARVLQQQILADIEAGLGEQLRTLDAYAQGAAQQQALDRSLDLDFTGFLPVWGLEDVEPDSSIYRGRNRRRKIDHALPYLQPLLSPMLDALADWQVTATRDLTATLDTGDHRPQIGLFIAFAKLFRHAQDTLNSLSGRYSRFYYRNVLRERPQGGIPDSVYLTFLLAQNEDVLQTAVPAGTRFSAGQDADGTDILYAADEALTVTAAQLSALQALRVLRGPLVTGEASPELASPDGGTVIQRVLSTVITLPEAEGTTVPPWSTFGRARTGTTDSETTTSSLLGFAIASTYLLLTGGERTATLHISLTASAAELLSQQLEQLSEASSQPPGDILRSVLEQAFDLYLSTAGGWMSVDSYSVFLPKEVAEDAEGADAEGETLESSFALRFVLPPSAPSIVAYDPDDLDSAEESSGDGSAEVSEDPEILASNPDPTLPTLKAYVRSSTATVEGSPPLGLNEDGPGSPPSDALSVYPISLLSDLTVASYRIHTSIRGFTDLQLENTDGEIDTSSPFLLLGGLPVVGSYLKIHSEELFRKQLRTFGLDLQWFNLPQNETGFKGYYRDYVIGLDGKLDANLFDNQVFRADLTIEQPGYWELLASPPADVYLFRTQDDCNAALPSPAGTLCSETRFDHLQVVAPTETPAYYDPASSSVRLQLEEPPYAFGNDLYAQNVLYSVIEDLPNAEKCQVDCEAASQPLADAARCIEDCIVCIGVCNHPSASTKAVFESPDQGYVERCLENCRECLWRLLVTCLGERYSACLGASTASANTASAQIRDLVEQRAELCRQAGQSDQGWCLERLQRDLSEVLGADAGSCFAEGSEVCLKIFEAIQCVVGCGNGCQESTAAESYPGCVVSCLEVCKGQMQLAYEQSLELCMADCLSLKNELRYPNEPWLPQVESLAVDYSASCSWRATEQDGCGAAYLLWPYGGSSVAEPVADDQRPLLPQFPNEGNLFLGFEALLPPQTLTMLFEMTSRQVACEPEQPPTVVWEYLADNCWRQLGTRGLSRDTSNGLQNTGVVALKLPTYEASGSTLMATEYQWLRASVATGAQDFPRTAALDPQVLLATWVGDDMAGSEEASDGSIDDSGDDSSSSDGEHLQQPLPAGTITSSVEDLPDIETIEQPMASFGGRPAETRRTFEMRLSERLRHKNRAVLAWDYERLVLERFPTVWQVAALPTRACRRQQVPGAVLVVVVPGPEGTTVQDPTVPAAPTDELARIASYLEERTNPFQELAVVNPTYVRIEVTTTVRFTEGENPGDLLERLDEDLVLYLSPWFYDLNRAARGGSYACQADISEFIQTRDYVDVMESISFDYSPRLEEMASDWYFLTSAEEHQIHDADSQPVVDEGCY